MEIFIIMSNLNTIVFDPAISRVSPISASYAFYALTASYAPSILSDYATSASWASQSLSASYLIWSENNGSASWAKTASWSPAPNYTSSLYGTASWADYVVNGGNSDTASYISSSAIFDLTIYNLTASNALTASYAMNSDNRSNYMPYEMVYTSSTNWITCSFATSSQYVWLSGSGAGTISFTSSNHPTDGNFADIILFVSNSLIDSPALSFPSSWLCMNGLWPLSITIGSAAIIWLRGYDTNKVIGTYHENLV